MNGVTKIAYRANEHPVPLCFLSLWMVFSFHHWLSSSSSLSSSCHISHPFHLFLFFPIFLSLLPHVSFFSFLGWMTNRVMIMIHLCWLWLYYLVVKHISFTRKQIHSIFFFISPFLLSLSFLSFFSSSSSSLSLLYIFFLSLFPHIFFLPQIIRSVLFSFRKHNEKKYKPVFHKDQVHHHRDYSRWNVLV